MHLQSPNTQRTRSSPLLVSLPETDSEKPVSTIALVYGHLLHIGGVETHLLSLLRHGNQSRYRWLIIAPTSPTFRALAEALGAQVIHWKPAHPLDVVALIRLVRLLRAEPVDLLHIQSARAALFGRMAARLLGLPVIVTVHLPPYYFAHRHGVRALFKCWFYHWAERILNVRLTDQLIYVSSRVCQEAFALNLAPRERTIVIQNGIDLTAFANDGQSSAVREALDTPPEATVLCCVGRLDEQKGVDVLLEALHQMDLDQQTRVWLVGDGPQREALETRSRQLGLDANVRFLGFRSDVPDFIKASDIFVLPSRYEAMPMTILEAMAAGLPCVVTDVGDNAELVENGVTGRVIPPEAPGALADALKELTFDRTLRRAMGSAARQKAQRYDVRQMVARTLDIYERVLKRQ